MASGRGVTLVLQALSVALYLYLATATEVNFTGGAASEGCQPRDQGTRPLSIMIMTQGRSGSTMLGELFRQNQDVLYVFEPCRYSGNGPMGNHGEFLGHECVALASRLAQCNFTWKDVDRLLSVDGFAIWQSSPYFKSLTATRTDHGGMKAVDLAHKALQNKCMQSRAVVVKTIRAFDGVGGPSHDVPPDLFVLHLARDPRAVARSQILHLRHRTEQYKVGTSGDKMQILRNAGSFVCNSFRKQLDSAENLGDGRYLLLRFEDISAAPTPTAELVYCWSGLGEVPAYISRWIHDNTNFPDCSSSHDQGGGKVKCSENLKQPFGTRRNSSAMAHLWRSQMDEKKASVVWEACKESKVMVRLGYAP